MKTLKDIQEEEMKRFEEKFYEGERNSVYCHKHSVFATPHEIKSFLTASLTRVALAMKDVMMVEEGYEVESIEPEGVRTPYGEGFEDGIKDGWNDARTLSLQKAEKFLKEINPQ